jgi:hypothetical protein
VNRARQAVESQREEQQRTGAVELAGGGRKEGLGSGRASQRWEEGGSSAGGVCGVGQEREDGSVFFNGYTRVIFS